MTHFPDKPHDGEQVVESRGDGAVRIWTYSQAKNEWTYEDYTSAPVGQVVYTDQVIDRTAGVTQSTVNVATAATASATQQNVDEIQGTKSKGTWQFHGGPLPPDGVPAVNQFWLADKEDQRTQEFCEAVFVRIHALGSQNTATRDRVELGSAVVGDRLIIQNLADTDGCSYTITSVEEHEPIDGDYTKSYALYGVTPDPSFCIGSVSPSEIVSIKLKTAPTEGSDGDYLPLSGGTANKMKGILYMGGNRIAGVGDPDAETDAVNRKYVDGKIDAIEIPGPELSTKDKLYLQGFYPFRVSEGSSLGGPGEVIFKDQNYLADVNPESWKYIDFSVVDAYGQGQVGKFMNHMQMTKFRQGQMWFLKENGFKICSYIGMMKAKDTNFESFYGVEMDTDREMVVSEHYDVAPLRIDKGEVIWIKCSFWG